MAMFAAAEDRGNATGVSEELLLEHAEKGGVGDASFFEFDMLGMGNGIERTYFFIIFFKLCMAPTTAATAFRLAA